MNGGVKLYVLAPGNCYFISLLLPAVFLRTIRMKTDHAKPRFLLRNHRCSHRAENTLAEGKYIHFAKESFVYGIAPYLRWGSSLDCDWESDEALGT